MKHHPHTERFEIYCHEHKPLPLVVEENKSVWERIDEIVKFVEGYSDLMRKNSDLVKTVHCMLQSQDDMRLGERSVWTDAINKLIYEHVAQAYFSKPLVQDVIYKGILHDDVSPR